MNILYIHQYFRTPEEGGAVRSYYLSKALVDAGHNVFVISAHNHHHSETKNIEGINVTYLPVFYANKYGFLARAFAFLKFLWLAYKKAITFDNIDICYCTSTPLTVGIVALWLKKRKKIPFYFEVRDLWPEAPIQMGALKNPILIAILRKLELDLYVNAERLIALSPGMRDGINKRVPGKAVSVLPNMSDTEFFGKAVDKQKAFNRFGIDLSASFNIAYIGAIGKVNRMDALLETALECQIKQLNVRFLIAGEGGELNRIFKRAIDLNLTNVVFTGFLNKEGIRELLSICQATYISFCDKPILTTNSPNKFFDSLAAGKLCIINIEGWIKELIEEKQCGFHAHQASDFIEKLTPYLEDQSKLIECQENAKKLSEYFSRKNTTKTFLRLFDPEMDLEMAISSVYTLTA